MTVVSTAAAATRFKMTPGPVIVDAQPLKIVGCPAVEFSGLRKELMEDYIVHNYGEKWPYGATLTPKMIVLHYTASNSLDSVLSTFAPAETDRKELIPYGKVNVASHFIVDRDGTVCRFLDETILARHAGGVNPLAIGVENVARNAAALTDAQVRANIKLSRDLIKRFPEIQYVIGHFEANRFRGIKGFWFELDAKKKNDHGDPGRAFMEKVRGGLSAIGVSVKAGP